jgi:hypothetical protein
MTATRMWLRGPGELDDTLADDSTIERSAAGWSCRSRLSSSPWLRRYALKGRGQVKDQGGPLVRGQRPGVYDHQDHR